MSREIELADSVYQDGAQFYCEAAGPCDSHGFPARGVVVASYPELVAHDYDFLGAIRARDKFADEYPAHIASRPAFYSVALYMCDRSYGGPEEGGWWFDNGEPCESLPDGFDAADLCRLFRSEADAIEWRDELESRVAALNEGRPSIGSMRSQGEYRARVCDGYPRAFPESKPFYE